MSANSAQRSDSGLVSGESFGFAFVRFAISCVCAHNARSVCLRLRAVVDAVDDIEVVVGAADLVVSGSRPLGLATDERLPVATARNAARCYRVRIGAAPASPFDPASMSLMLSDNKLRTDLEGSCLSVQSVRFSGPMKMVCW